MGAVDQNLAQKWMEDMGGGSCQVETYVFFTRISWNLDDLDVLDELGF